MHTTMTSFGSRRGYFFAGTLSLMFALSLWALPASASNSATATKDCTFSPCTTTAAQFTIASAQVIEWQANYLGAGNQGNDFYIHDAANINLIEIPLSTNLTAGFNTGTQLLNPGTYAISITYFGMGPGSYTIIYDRTATIGVSPANHAFAVQPVGTSSAPFTFTVSKTGDLDVTISNVVSSDPHFAVSGAPIGQVVGPNQSFQVTYVAGTTVGLFGGNITVSGTSSAIVPPAMVGTGNTALTGSTGDPHLTTVDGVNYDFQGAGEFVSLRDADGMEIQTRETPVATASVVGPNAHTGLTTCVSINTAVAARVGKQRVTIQPNISGVPDPSGLQLRVDGILTAVGANGLNLESGGRVVKSSVGDGFEIDFPNGAALFVTPLYWTSQSKWYLNLEAFLVPARQRMIGDVAPEGVRTPATEGIMGAVAAGSLRTPATEGIMGAVAAGSWLPALPDGTTVGPMPGSLHQRYVDLYEKFADAWRVTDKNSLFDYAPGTSTETFTLRSWPPENPPCVIPGNPLAKPLGPRVAQKLCEEVADKNMNANCVFDVTVTGEPGFAKLYLLSQRIRVGSTTTTVNDAKNPTQVREPATFTAIVAPRTASGRGLPAGTVQFTLDGHKVAEPVKLDSNGRATWKTSRLKVGNHKVGASYLPSAGSPYLPSSSPDKPHVVRECGCLTR